MWSSQSDLEGLALRPFDFEFLLHGHGRLLSPVTSSSPPYPRATLNEHECNILAPNSMWWPMLTCVPFSEYRYLREMVWVGRQSGDVEADQGGAITLMERPRRRRRARYRSSFGKSIVGGATRGTEVIQAHHSSRNLPRWCVLNTGPSVPPHKAYTPAAAAALELPPQPCRPLKHTSDHDEYRTPRPINACLFDVFVTILNWHSTVTCQVARLSKGLILEGTLPTNLTDNPLKAYQDTIPDLEKLKCHVYILVLSNGNLNLLLDLVIEPPHYAASDLPQLTLQAKNQGVPWDGIFSSEMFISCKPKNKEVYESAAYHLSLPSHKIATVAADNFDLLVAASVGFQTIYVPPREVREGMRSKKDNGEVNLVVRFSRAGEADT
ncbi:uncharacterized protein EDB91DRAFT_1244618 [Suillus paluster]|uniref:uncharacterized protein n=1 Tax=Suillus paluster TaxID=48578 RepID=UPI001B879A4B|nr:uncharacterized protein EDB91DRAFT_1244618 [Suillus paluster]KAG1750028.1 hypothetical protein EDB91DRAFT_1244618 [Suillus paluster]